MQILLQLILCFTAVISDDPFEDTEYYSRREKPLRPVCKADSPQNYEYALEAIRTRLYENRRQRDILDRGAVLLWFVQTEPSLESPNLKLSPGQRSDFYLLWVKTLYNYNRNTSLLEKTALKGEAEKKPAADNNPSVTRYSLDNWEENGNPRVYNTPSSWDAAKNDGERIEYVFSHWEKVNKKTAMAFRAIRAQKIYGVKEAGMGCNFFYDTFLQYPSKAEIRKLLPSLKENESIRITPQGALVYTLPKKLNYMEMYRQLDSWLLADEYANRLQYEKALAHLIKLKTALEKNPNGYCATVYCGGREFREKGVNPNDALNDLQKINQLCNQITAPQGAIIHQCTQNGRPVLVYRYRHAGEAEFTAQKFDLNRWIENSLVEKTAKEDSTLYRTIFTPYFFLYQKEKDYAAYIQTPPAAQWTEKLPEEQPLSSPLLDGIAFIHLPITQSGAYLITARRGESEPSRAIVWISGLKLIVKNVDNEHWFYTADSQTGKPVPQVNVSLFCLDMKRYAPVKNPDTNSKSQISPERAAERKFGVASNANQVSQCESFLTDADGVAKRAHANGNRKYSWLLRAVAPDGRTDYLYLPYKGDFGDNSILNVNPQYGDERQRHLSFWIADRPIYRPGDTVNFKVWIRRPEYDLAEREKLLEGTKIYLTVRGREGIIHKKEYILDSSGALAGSFPLDSRTAQGGYYYQVSSGEDVGLPWNYVKDGRLGFLVESYRKPEWQVEIQTPSEPVFTGEKIPITVKSRYNFDAPAAGTKVKIQIDCGKQFKDSFSQWDYEKEFDSSKTHKGTRPPQWIRMLRAEEKKKNVRNPFCPLYSAKRTVEGVLNSQGEFTFQIDTSEDAPEGLNRTLVYNIYAEVIDSSLRRATKATQTETCTKTVFWSAGLDKNICHAGKTIQARFRPYYTTGAAAAGKYKIQIEKLDKQTQSITPFAPEMTVQTDSNGEIVFNYAFPQPGQYRLGVSGLETNAEPASVVYLTVLDEKMNLKEVDLPPLEIVPEKTVCKAGETIKLTLVTNAFSDDSTAPALYVWLFSRNINGCCIKPRLIRLEKSFQIVELPVHTSDAPNFFVEALTVRSNKVYSCITEIDVAGKSPDINVNITTERKVYKPGEKVRMKITLTDSQENPVSGQVALSVYDKILDTYVSEQMFRSLKKTFWSWRRSGFRETTYSRFGFCGDSEYSENMICLGVYGNLFDKNRLYSLPGLEQLDFDSSLQLEDNLFYAIEKSLCNPENALFPAMKTFPFSGGSSQAERYVTNAPRRDFADTAYWNTNIFTNYLGWAECEFVLPDTLTTWAIRAWTVGDSTQVGQGCTELVTSKGLIVRPHVPRYMIQGDTIELAAEVKSLENNEKERCEEDQRPGSTEINPLESSLSELSVCEVNKAERPSPVPYLLAADSPGERKYIFSAKAENGLSDAVEVSIPVYEHGIAKRESFRKTLCKTPERFEFTVSEKNKNSTLDIQISSSILSAMTGAVPFLIEYPHECSEQTANRFVGLILADNTFRKIYPDKNAIYTFVKKSEFAAMPNIIEPKVYTKEDVERFVRRETEKLFQKQNQNGAWGWLNNENADVYTTAVVAHALLSVYNTDYSFMTKLSETKTYLEQYIQNRLEELENPNMYTEDLDALVYSVLAEFAYVESLSQQTEDELVTPAEERLTKIARYLFRDRKYLSRYSRLLLAVGLDNQGDYSQRDLVLREQTELMNINSSLRTAHLSSQAKEYWLWRNSEIEINARLLQLLCRTGQMRLADGVARWLTDNRSGQGAWDSTRDTGLALEALAEYLDKTGNRSTSGEVEIHLDGALVKTAAFQSADPPSACQNISIDPELLKPGKHEIQFKPKGMYNNDAAQTGMFISAQYSYFDTADFISASGLEIGIARKYWRVSGENRVEVKPEDAVKPGETIEVEIILSAPSRFEHLLIEDYKPAGFEPINTHSGYMRGGTVWAYAEFRDFKTCLYISSLPPGEHRFSYRIRAEHRGCVSALPATVESMYAPTLRSNSDERKLRVSGFPWRPD